ncbi:MAG: ABC transporter permease [Candidatus Babeliaceae bacterium]|nr:ABC transporter permease [Candidatus Babeliaceae bacterium]
MNFNRIILLVKRAWTLTFRGIDPLTDFFYWPLFDIIVWGFTGSWMSENTSNPQLAVIILTSLVLWQAVYRTNLDISYNFLTELWSRNMINLFVTPLTIQEWIFANMLAGAINACIATVFAMSAVWLLYGIFIPSIGFLFPFLAFCLFFSGWSLGLVTTSVLVTQGAQAQKIVWVMGWLFVPFMGIFYPVDIMPLWAQAIAYSLPMTYFFKILRTYLQFGTFDMSLFTAGAALSCVYFITAFSLFIYFFQRSRHYGLARLEDM